MLRLVLDWFGTTGDVLEQHPLVVEPDCQWHSEALLPSQFKPRHRGDKLAEAYTHADGVIGHFEMGKSGKGDVALLYGARRFVVTEAKMFSGLSSGTKNAPGYDQAARNVACIAALLTLAERRPGDMDFLAFIVLAPQSRIDEGAFSDKLDKEHIRKTVLRRVEQYEGNDLAAKRLWFDDWFTLTLEKCRIRALSWEAVLADIRAIDPAAADEFGKFYEQCLAFNGRPKPETESDVEDEPNVLKVNAPKHRSKSLQKFCREIREQRDNACENCGATEEQCQIEAHHILEPRLFPRFEKEPGNIIVLCQPCHAQTASRGMVDMGDNLIFYGSLPVGVRERATSFLKEAVPHMTTLIAAFSRGRKFAEDYFFKRIEL